MSVAKGTTPTITLTFTEQTLDLTQASHVYVSFKGLDTIIEKKDEDLVIAAKSISVYLTQAETLSLYQGDIQIQANWTYADGSRSASEIVKFSFGGNLIERVIE